MGAVVLVKLSVAGDQVRPTVVGAGAAFTQFDAKETTCSVPRSATIHSFKGLDCWAISLCE